MLQIIPGNQFFIFEVLACLSFINHIRRATNQVAIMNYSGSRVFNTLEEYLYGEISG